MIEMKKFIKELEADVEALIKSIRGINS